MADLYFINSSSNSFDDIGNWFLDINYTSTSPSLPDSTTELHIAGICELASIFSTNKSITVVGELTITATGGISVVGDSLIINSICNNYGLIDVSNSASVIINSGGELTSHECIEGIIHTAGIFVNIADFIGSITGDLSSTIINHGSMEQTDNCIFNGILENNGTIVQISSTIYCGGTITNGGSIDIVHELSIDGGTFTNDGTLTLQGNSKLVLGDGTFINNGVLNKLIGGIIFPQIRSFGGGISF